MEKRVCKSSPVHKFPALRCENQSRSRRTFRLSRSNRIENVDLRVFFISSLCFMIIQYFCPGTVVVTSLHWLRHRRVHVADLKVHMTFIWYVSEVSLKHFSSFVVLFSDVVIVVNLRQVNTKKLFACMFYIRGRYIATFCCFCFRAKGHNSYVGITHDCTERTLTDFNYQSINLWTLSAHTTILTCLKGDNTH